MDPLAPTAALEAAILNKCFPVRRFCRPGQRALRARAIADLGLTVREAFNASDDFEPLLLALYTGLAPRDDSKPF